MKSFNVFGEELDERRDQPGFSRRRARVGAAVGGEVDYWDGES